MHSLCGRGRRSRFLPHGWVSRLDFSTRQFVPVDAVSQVRDRKRAAHEEVNKRNQLDSGYLHVHKISRTVHEDNIVKVCTALYCSDGRASVLLHTVERVNVAMSPSASTAPLIRASRATRSVNPCCLVPSPPPPLCRTIDSGE